MYAALAPADPAVFPQSLWRMFCWNHVAFTFSELHTMVCKFRPKKIVGIVDMFSVVISILVFIDFVWFAILFYQ